MARYAVMGLRVAGEQLAAVVIHGEPAAPLLLAARRTPVGEIARLVDLGVAAAAAVGREVARAGLVLDDLDEALRRQVVDACAARGFPTSSQSLEHLRLCARRYLDAGDAELDHWLVRAGDRLAPPPPTWGEMEAHALLAAMAALQVATDEIASGILPTDVVRRYPR